jgi:hypothetical protein
MNETDPVTDNELLEKRALAAIEELKEAIMLEALKDRPLSPEEWGLYADKMKVLEATMLEAFKERRLSPEEWSLYADKMKVLEAIMLEAFEPTKAAIEATKRRVARSLTGQIGRLHRIDVGVSPGEVEEGLHFTRLITAGLLSGVITPDSDPPGEVEEANQIYQRIDRELAVEEARADRLLRLYGL